MTVPHRPPPGTVNSNPVWPQSLERVAAVRFARRSNQFESTVQFYRDLVRLPVHETFTNSYSSDGVIFGLPDASADLRDRPIRRPRSGRSARTALPLLSGSRGDGCCAARSRRGQASSQWRRIPSGRLTAPSHIAIPRVESSSSRRSSTEPTSEVPCVDRCVSRIPTPVHAPMSAQRRSKRRSLAPRASKYVASTVSTMRGTTSSQAELPRTAPGARTLARIAPIAFTVSQWAHRAGTDVMSAPNSASSVPARTFPSVAGARWGRGKPMSRRESPPGQYLTTDFPVLSAGSTPRTPLDRWSSPLEGLVREPVSWTWGSFLALRAGSGRSTSAASRIGRSSTCAGAASASTRYSSTSISNPSAAFAIGWSDGGYTTNLPLEGILNGQAFVAFNLAVSR